MCVVWELLYKATGLGGSEKGSLALFSLVVSMVVVVLLMPVFEVPAWTSYFVYI